MNGICACCDVPGPIEAFGWREACYTRWRRAGRPASGPPPRRRLTTAEPIVRYPRVITCDSCGEEKEHHARGWCASCWKRWDYSGRPESGPPPRKNGRWEEYAELTREQHYTLREAAIRMGISHRTAQRYEAWLLEAGVPKPAYQHGQAVA